MTDSTGGADRFGRQDGGVVIRPAMVADLAAIGRLGALLVRTHHELDSQRFIAATSATERGYTNFLSSQVDERDVVIMVAESKRKIVGYSYAGVEGTDYMALRGPAGVLHDLVVDTAHRGRGIGQGLLEATIEELRRRGAPAVMLWTAEPNEAARRLFEKAGFRPTMVEMMRALPDNDGNNGR